MQTLKKIKSYKLELPAVLFFSIVVFSLAEKFGFKTLLHLLIDHLILVASKKTKKTTKKQTAAITKMLTSGWPQSF